jgi:hypothetical protein
MSQKIPIRKFSFRHYYFLRGHRRPHGAVPMAVSATRLTRPAVYRALLFVITLFTMFVVMRDDQGKEGKRFVSNYMLSRVVKLLSCLLFLLLYLFLNRADAIRFAIAFLVIYFLYSIFEVVLLRMENREIQKKPTAETKNNPNEYIP